MPGKSTLRSLKSRQAFTTKTYGNQTTLSGEGQNLTAEKILKNIQKNITYNRLIMHINGYWQKLITCFYHCPKTMQDQPKASPAY